MPHWLQRKDFKSHTAPVGAGFKADEINSYVNLLEDDATKDVFNRFSFDKLHKEIGNIVKANSNFSKTDDLFFSGETYVVK